LIRAENVGRGDTGTGGADIESLGEFNELGTGRVGAADEDGNLELDARRATSWGVIHALPYLIEFGLHGQGIP
jgi:hypothetical protein